MAEAKSPIHNVRWQDKTAIVDCSGEIDLHRSSGFQKELMTILHETPQKMVINLSDVSYMDSSGVASLVKLLSRTRSSGTDLCLLSPTPKVMSVLQITLLDSVFDICESEEEAVS
ncbi:MAG: anti-sigma factor antagonist [Planctomycetes bacterium]|jgi:anti-sigma B factor antagonist|nr:anti-sigma factor antagonist [Planctomycetota bacterium]